MRDKNHLGLLIILTLLFSTILPSCVGIGDKQTTSVNNLEISNNELSEVDVCETITETTTEKNIDPTFFKFTPELEEIDVEQMNEIRELWANYWKEKAYNKQYSFLASEGKDPDTCRIEAEKIANESYDFYYSEMFFDHYAQRYYGIINDCVVLARKTSIGSVTTYTLGSCELYITGVICVCVNSKVMELNVAYENGLLTDDDILIISQRHEMYGKAYTAWLNETRGKIGN